MVNAGERACSGAVVLRTQSDTEQHTSAVRSASRCVLHAPHVSRDQAVSCIFATPNGNYIVTHDDRAWLRPRRMFVLPKTPTTSRAVLSGTRLPSVLWCFVMLQWCLFEPRFHISSFGTHHRSSPSQKFHSIIHLRISGIQVVENESAAPSATRRRETRCEDGTSAGPCTEDGVVACNLWLEQCCNPPHLVQ